MDNSEDMSPLQMKTLAALTYLLAQQFIDARTTLEELATKISPGNRSEDLLSGDVWLIPAMVELDRHLFPRRKQLPETHDETGIRKDPEPVISCRLLCRAGHVRVLCLQGICPQLFGSGR